ncbi:helix-turn-helix domain-containing protein [Pseudogracilibacillus sp. SO30301A]|uniref:helix-turn-helix domain-containing protein n=1 Tax=Pseudogracilibacillus sp. SO30301A TaxID=3098291 RepID=UPI00300E5A0A
MEIGEILREARLAKNLSLDDVQEMTKIQKRYLAAIEQDEFHALPGRFYARAFIKEYAQAVGLDPTEVLQDFDEDKIQTEEEQTVQYTRMERSRRTRPSKVGSSIFSLLPTIIVIILVIGIIFVAWTLYQQAISKSDTEIEGHQESDEIIRNVDEPGKEEEETNENDPNEEKGETDESESDSSTSEASFSVVETGTGNSPTSEVDFTFTGNQAEVTFEVHDRVYVEAKGASEKTYVASTLEANTESESIDVSEEERIYFNVGNANGLTIKINGVELEYPIDPQETVHQKLWVNLKQNE